MSSYVLARRVVPALVIAVQLLLAACSNNTYGPPPANGVPQNWGQQHYLDVQKRLEENRNRIR
jgi:hypothetical protein